MFSKYEKYEISVHQRMRNEELLLIVKLSTVSLSTTQAEDSKTIMSLIEFFREVENEQLKKSMQVSV